VTETKLSVIIAKKPMSNEQERYCAKCGRVYSWEDWQESSCPFCDLPLEEIGVAAPSSRLNDTLSSEIPWPQGEREVEIYRAAGFLEAQMLKAQLEAANIPVMLQAGTSLGFTVGSLGEVPVLVPKSRWEEARDILENNAD
jgi:hypothetical protein